MKKLSSKQIQDRLYEMLVYIDEVCRKNDIQYILSSGTCLGAIRHHDFIPWDDDADIYMDRENYKKFFEVVEKEGGRFKVYDYKTQPTYLYPFPKLVDTKTIIKEKKVKQIEDMGLFVDIFFIDGVPGNVFARTLQKIELNCLKTRLFSKIIIKNPEKDLVDQKDYQTIHNILEKIDKLCAKYSPKESPFAMNLAWGGKPCRSSLYYDLIDVLFRKHKFFVFRDYDTYLKTNYGNYMELPPESERIGHETEAYEII